MTNGSGQQPARRPASSPQADPDRQISSGMPDPSSDLLSTGDSIPETGAANASEAVESREGERRRLQAERARAREESRTERDRLRRLHTKELPEESDLDGGRRASLDAFSVRLETDSSTPPRGQWNLTEIYRNRDEYRIDPLNWNDSRITTKAGLEQIYMDFEKLGLLKGANESFYKTMFFILNNGAEYIKDADPTGDEADWFKSPYNNLEQIKGIAPNNTFVGGEIYAKALAHLQEVKALVEQHEYFEQSIKDAQEEIQSGGSAQRGLEAVSGAISANWNKFTESLNKGDYATAGLYMLGMYAAFRAGSAVYGRMQQKNSTFLFWGPAIAAAGYMFSKNAGYDLLGMAGVETMDTGLTPFKAMEEFIDARAELKRRVGEIDYNLIYSLEAKEFTLEYLHDELAVSEDPSSGRIKDFIPPERFRGIAPSKILAVRQHDIKDAERTGRSLTREEQEYLRIGKQLFNIALTFREMYNDNLRDKEGFYKGMEYEEAITRSDGIKRPQELMAAMVPHSRVLQELLEAREIKAVQDEVNARLSRGGASWPYNRINIKEKRDDNDFLGTMMGVPVLVKWTDGNYQLAISSGNGTFSDRLLSLRNVEDPNWFDRLVQWFMGHATNLIVNPLSRLTLHRFPGTNLSDFRISPADGAINYRRDGTWEVKMLDPNDQEATLMLTFDDEGNIQVDENASTFPSTTPASSEAPETEPASRVDLDTLPGSPDEITPENLEDVRPLVNGARAQIASDESLTQAQKNDYTRRLDRLDARILMIDASQKIEAVMNDINRDPDNLNLLIHEEKAKEIRALFERAVALGEVRENMGVLSSLQSLESMITNLKFTETIRERYNWNMDESLFFMNRLDRDDAYRQISGMLANLGIPPTADVSVRRRAGARGDVINIRVKWGEEGNSKEIVARSVRSSHLPTALTTALIELEMQYKEISKDHEGVKEMLRESGKNWEWEAGRDFPEARTLLAMELTRKGYPLDTRVRISSRTIHSVTLEIGGRSFTGRWFVGLNKYAYHQHGYSFGLARDADRVFMNSLSRALVDIPRYER